MPTGMSPAGTHLRAGDAKSPKVASAQPPERHMEISAANDHRPPTAATARDYGAAGAVCGDEVTAGVGGTRPTQRIRSPLRSRRGSTPKPFCSEVAQRSRLGFPRRVCLWFAKIPSAAFKLPLATRSGDGGRRYEAARSAWPMMVMRRRTRGG